MEANYIKTALEVRNKVLDLIYKAQSSHIGSNFSCIDILTVLFNKIDLDKDKFILSKGWAAASLYFFLWKQGRITLKDLNSYCKDGSKFIGLAEPIIPEIPFAGGSMGMGFPAAVGFALAKKIKKEEGNIYVLMSDGEMDIGTTWESALIAAHHKLDNLVVIVDYNKFQVLGLKNRVIGIEPLMKKWEVFNWFVFEIDGHKHEHIENSILRNVPIKNYEMLSALKDRPTVIVAHTVKGKGVSFMENDNIWHYKAPNKDEYLKAKKELCQT